MVQNHTVQLLDNLKTAVPTHIILQSNKTTTIQIPRFRKIEMRNYGNSLPVVSMPATWTNSVILCCTPALLYLQQCTPKRFLSKFVKMESPNNF